ncbi:REF/SRPP-like protein At3g05500 [Abrus precatorius]|uniref:REF/SRPP-like protein At3g05500 n=1 Tax=Abrus precatorius TaxID=3816 RepID=A0A8B8L141_ABRPR|nr:REF/SRPP-like protein At3g05500 [Abrus precatorius]
MRAAAVYARAKDRSGPGVRSVEEAVKNVISPVYDKFHLVPDELLRHAVRYPDRSVAAAHSPAVAARPTASDIPRTVYAKCEPSARVLYERYEGKTAVAWRRLKRVSTFPRVSEKYDEAFVAAAEKGFRVWGVERIAKVFSE